jgi:D-proline reductase (dithiol) PrdB
VYPRPPPRVEAPFGPRPSLPHTVPWPPIQRTGGGSRLSQETFEEFLASLAYGSRNDLTFKFLKNLSAEAGYDFFQSVLTDIEEIIDAGDVRPLLQTIYERQLDTYSSGDPNPTFGYDDAPWAPLKKPLAESRVALLSAGGVYVDGDDPKGEPSMTQEEAATRINEFIRNAPDLSVIPVDTPAAELRIRHPGYDVRGSRRDYNCVFPLDRLHEAVAAGRIGELAADAFSFVGAAAQLRIRGQFAPDLVERLQKYEVDAAFLVAV